MPRKHASTDEETEINVTPMLDIVFIMLIFFIVTTSFVKETGVDPARPQAQTAAKQDLASIFVGVTRDGEIWMEKKKIDLPELRVLVERARAENPESNAVIVADEKAGSGVVMDVMDQLSAAGVTGIAVAATPPAE